MTQTSKVVRLFDYEFTFEDNRLRFHNVLNYIDIPRDEYGPIVTVSADPERAELVIEAAHGTFVLQNFWDPDEMRLVLRDRTEHNTETRSEPTSTTGGRE
jgi:hypothetical protein